MDMDGLLELEKGITARKREEGRLELQARLQAEADALGTVGADGQPLKRVRRIGMVVDTTRLSAWDWGGRQRRT